MSYTDPNLPLEQRIEELLSSMTLEEKTTQLRFAGPAIERLGVPEYNWWNECLHGVARAGRATVFPQAIAFGATFNPELIFRVAEAIAAEARAKHHHAVRLGRRGQYEGLTFWTPNINIFRDPRWGRGQETYGEDPFLTSEIGKAFVRGLQGEHPDYLKAAACAKHYAVHSGPEGLRHEFNAEVSEKDLRETYLPAFKALVDEGVEAVMGAYNRTNGEPCCAHSVLMEEILRGEWQFAGHYVSDCWAIRDFHEHHGITQDAAESAALAVKKGCDLNCGSVYEGLMESIERGLVAEKEIDRSLRRLLRTRFRLGMFDPDELVPWTDTPLSVVGCDAHRDLAREVAVQSCVLLKNDGLLPLDASKRRLFVTGPAAADSTVLLANYHGTSDRLITILEGITARSGNERSVTYRQGFGFDAPVRNPLNYAFGEARQSDVVIACIGISSHVEGEEGDAYASDFAGDKRDLSIPADQIEYLRKLKSRGTPLVTVVTGGSPLDLSEVHELSDAVLFAWYPGEEGGNAIASLIFGDRSPAGRLPVTFPKSVDQLPPFDEYAMAGRTYRYMREEPMYPFGFGLTYSDLRYESLEHVACAAGAAQAAQAAQAAEGAEGAQAAEAAQAAQAAEAAEGAEEGAAPEGTEDGPGVTLELTLRNTGRRGVEEVVQLYTALVNNDGSQPTSRLVRIRRVWLAPAGQPGSEARLRLRLDADAFTCVEEDGVRRPRAGAWRIIAAGCAPGRRGPALGAPEPVEVTVER